MRCVANVTFSQPSSEIALPALIGTEMRRWTARLLNNRDGGPWSVHNKQGYCVHGVSFWIVREALAMTSKADFRGSCSCHWNNIEIYGIVTLSGQ